MNICFNEFDNQEQLTSALSLDIEAALRNAIDCEGSASLAVSGGRSPLALFEKLSKIDLPWEKVIITLIDERWVPNVHADSNEKLVRDFLLQGTARKAQFIPLKTEQLTPNEAETVLSNSLLALPEKLTVSLLGMGEDGHTASFFPNTQSLDKALSLDGGRVCQAIYPTTAPHPRMTLTLPRILASKKILLQLSGEKKKCVYERAIQGKDSVNELPVKSVLMQSQTPVSVYWAP